MVTRITQGKFAMFLAGGHSDRLEEAWEVVNKAMPYGEPFDDKCPKCGSTNLEDGRIIVSCLECGENIFVFE